MENKEYQIKEMANIIKAVKYEPFNYGKPTYTVGNQMQDFVFDLIAEELLKHYQPRLPENSVVILKEEYEEYKKIVDGKAIMIENITDLNRVLQFPIEYDSKMFDDIADFGNYVQEQANKETAREILNKFDKLQEDLSKKIEQLKEPFRQNMNGKEKDGYTNGILTAKSIVTSFKNSLAKQHCIEL